MNTSVNPKLAKLLKENGYRILPYFKSSYPTIADVVMWLYEEHGIWINVNITRYGNFWCNIFLKEECNDLDTKFNWEFINQLEDFSSPAEVYEAAIEYSLKKLM